MVKMYDPLIRMMLFNSRRQTKGKDIDIEYTNSGLGLWQEIYKDEYLSYQIRGNTKERFQQNDTNIKHLLKEETIKFFYPEFL